MTDDGQWKTVFYHYDGLGSVVALTDEKGKVVAEYDYSPFGRILQAKGGEAKKNAYLFAGREFDRDSGLYYNRARYYNSRTGSFTTVDPINRRPSINGWAMQDIPSGAGCLSCSGSRISNYSPWVPVPATVAVSLHQHPYVYCANNPVNYTDPMGLVTLKDCLELARCPRSEATCLAAKKCVHDIGVAEQSDCMLNALKALGPTALISLGGLSTIACAIETVVLTPTMGPQAAWVACGATMSLSWAATINSAIAPCKGISKSWDKTAESTYKWCLKKLE